MKRLLYRRTTLPSKGVLRHRKDILDFNRVLVGRWIIDKKSTKTHFEIANQFASNILPRIKLAYTRDRRSKITAKAP